MQKTYRYKNGIEIEILEKHTILKVNGNEIKYKNSNDAFNFAKTYKNISEINKKYNIIYADPPWSYIRSAKKGNKKITGCATQHYDTMSLQEIKNLPIKNIIDDPCVLFLWGTFPLINYALEVVKAWGFKYRTVAFTWIKTYKNGNFCLSLGNYTRGNAEICLLARSGKEKIDIKRRDISQLIISERGKHSRKPNDAREKILQLLGDLPRIELFSRNSTKGWDVWGNETDKFD